MNFDNKTNFVFIFILQDFIATVINLNIMQMFIELNVLIAADRKRPPINNDFSSFFYAHLLLERLRVCINKLYLNDILCKIFT